MTDEPDEPSPIATAKSGDEIFGIQLRPYSASRKVAAQSMGLMYPVVGQEGMDQMKRTGVYAGALKDAVIVIWLRSLRDQPEVDAARAATKEQAEKTALILEWTPSKALHQPAAALEVAMEWAGEIGFVEGESFEEAMVKMMATVRPVQEAEFTAKKDQATPEESGNV